MNRALRLCEAVVRSVVISVLILLGLFGCYALWDRSEVAGSAEQFEEDAIDEMALGDNENVVAWIMVPGTQINQPVAHGSDNDFYLRHNYKGEFATAGSAFLDYRNRGDLSDDFAIIYGHRMSGHLMFGDVKLFTDKEFFDAHDEAWLKVKGRKERVRIINYAVISAHDKLYDLKKTANGQNAENVRSIALGNELTRIYRGGRLIMLSTCDASAKQKRNVLLLEREK